MTSLCARCWNRIRETFACAGPAWEPWARVGVLLLVALCAGVRLWRLGREGLWEDEIRTARLASVPLPELFRSMLVEHDFAVPLLHLVVAKAGLAISQGELGLRLPSALFGLAGIGAAYLLGREAYSRREGWIAACFLAVSHEHLYYSREARPYSLLVLLVTLMLWAVLRAARTQACLLYTSPSPRD